MRDYKQAKNELDLLQRQYELEQQALNAKSETQEEQLKSLALDSTLVQMLLRWNCKLVLQQKKMN